MARFTHTHGTPLRTRPPRQKAIDRETHRALASLLATAIANKNINHHTAANKAAARLRHVLEVHGIAFDR